MSNLSGTVSSKLLYSLGVGVGVSLLGGLSYWTYKQYNKDEMPINWQRIGTLDQINLFPVKCCAPLQLEPNDAVDCEILGLRFNGILDRSLMLIDQHDAIVTARTYPKMVLIETQITGKGKLLITAKGMEPLQLDFNTLVQQATGDIVATSVWRSDVKALLCGEIYDNWFSRAVLGRNEGLRLVYYHHEKSVRSINWEMKQEKHITRDDTGAFGDATSYHLINLASVKDLNTRTPRFVHPQQFRASFNISADAEEAYAEDNWGWIRIGNAETGAVFRNVAPCGRCIVPNIDAFSGERDVDGEPQKTLRSYRQTKKYRNPLFGVHLGIRKPGTIKRKDVVYVGVN